MEGYDIFKGVPYLPKIEVGNPRMMTCAFCKKNYPAYYLPKHVVRCHSEGFKLLQQ